MGAESGDPAGDFWEKRLQLQVKDLCRVIPEIQRISMPTLMIPGNHDQVPQQPFSDRNLREQLNPHCPLSLLSSNNV